MPKIDDRGWVAIGLFGLSAMVLGALAVVPHLADNQTFDTLGTAIIVTGLINGVVSYLFGASKQTPPKDPTQ